METLELCDSDNFDNNWIEQYELSELEYSSFYKEKIENIKLNYVYVDDKNNISFVNQENMFIEDRKLDKEKIIEIINANKIKNKIQYKIISILKYNITLEPEHIKKYVNDDEYNDNFLSKVDILQDIYFKDTINLFQDLNCLYFIFCDKRLKENKHNITKKILLCLSGKKSSASNSLPIKKNRKTKKINAL